MELPITAAAPPTAEAGEDGLLAQSEEQQDALDRCRVLFNAFARFNTTKDVVTVEQLQAVLEGAGHSVSLSELELRMSELRTPCPEGMRWFDAGRVIGSVISRNNIEENAVSGGFWGFLKAFFCLVLYVFTFPFVRKSNTVRAVTLQLFHALRVPLHVRNAILKKRRATRATLGWMAVVWVCAFLFMWGVVDMPLVKGLVPQLLHGCGLSHPGLNCTAEQVPGLAVSAMERVWALYMMLTMCAIFAARVFQGAVQAMVPPALLVRSARGQGFEEIGCDCVLSRPWERSLHMVRGPAQRMSALDVLAWIHSVDNEKWKACRERDFRIRVFVATLLPVLGFSFIYLQRAVWGVGQGGKSLFGLSDHAGMAWASITGTLSAYAMQACLFLWLGEVYQSLRRKQRHLLNLRRLIDPAAQQGNRLKRGARDDNGTDTKLLLPLNRPNNVAAWRQCREFVVASGPAELREANVYLGGAVFFLIILLVYIVALRISKRLDSVSATKDEDMRVLLTTCFLALITVGGYMLYPSLFTAVAINDEYTTVRSTLEEAHFDLSTFSTVRRSPVGMGSNQEAQHTPNAARGAEAAAARRASNDGSTTVQPVVRLAGDVDEGVQAEQAKYLLEQLQQYLSARNDTLYVLGLPLDRRFVATVSGLILSGMAAAVSNLF